MLFSCQPIFSHNDFFLKKYLRNTYRVSNSLDSDRTQRFVWPDLGRNCLQRLSVEETPINER